VLSPLASEAQNCADCGSAGAMQTCDELLAALLSSSHLRFEVVVHLLQLLRLLLGKLLGLRRVQGAGAKVSEASGPPAQSNRKSMRKKKHTFATSAAAFSCVSLMRAAFFSSAD